MKESFLEAIAFTFQEEGFLSSDKWGGATVFGVARDYWPKDYDAIMTLIRKGDKAGAVAYATEFYRRNMWNRIHADDLPHPLDVVAFDSSVNPGPGWCVEALKQTQDWRKLLDERESYYEERARHNPEKKKDLKGWGNRCDALRAKYKELP